jgi:hypothetical protein
LSNVFFSDFPASFDFHDQAAFDHQISLKPPRLRSIFVEAPRLVFRLNIQFPLAKAIDQGVSVDFLQMAVSTVGMNGKTRRAHDVATLIHALPHSTPLSSLVLRLMSPEVLFVRLRVFCGESV